jgi:hypothetical protein
VFFYNLFGLVTSETVGAQHLWELSKRGTPTVKNILRFEGVIFLRRRERTLKKNTLISIVTRFGWQLNLLKFWILWFSAPFHALFYGLKGEKKLYKRLYIPQMWIQKTSEHFSVSRFLLIIPLFGEICFFSWALRISIFWRTRLPTDKASLFYFIFFIARNLPFVKTTKNACNFGD